MTKTITIFALVAAAALAGCDQSDHTINGNAPDDPQANAASAAPIVLPPSIIASHPYRCRDNSLVYIDWLSDGSARSKTDRAARAMPIQPGEAGEAGTTSLVGDAQATTVTYNGQSCKR